LSDPENLSALNDLFIDFEVEAEARDIVDRPRREKQRAELAAADADRLENQNARILELLDSMKKGGRRRTRKTKRRSRKTRRRHK
jgi:hypothetical protein